MDRVLPRLIILPFIYYIGSSCILTKIHILTMTAWPRNSIWDPAEIQLHKVLQSNGKRVCILILISRNNKYFCVLSSAVCLLIYRYGPGCQIRPTQCCRTRNGQGPKTSPPTANEDFFYLVCCIDFTKIGVTLFCVAYCFHLLYPNFWIS